MNLSEPKTIKNLLRKYEIRPSRRFGQNFLIDKMATKKIIEAAELKKDDTVLEIGPGIGTVTQELAKRAKRVVAVEKDRGMTEVLKETLKDFENVEIIQGDILKINPKYYIPDTEYRIVANLPFYITSPVIRHFLEAVDPHPQQMVLVVQKEVGQRICARPPRMSILAVSVQVYAEAKIISYISKKSFWPQPKVNAAIVKIIPSSRPLKPGINSFFEIVKAGFSQPRKQLVNNLSKGLKIGRKETEEWLKKSCIQPTQRAETLSVEDWMKLAKNYKI